MSDDFYTSVGSCKKFSLIVLHGMDKPLHPIRTVLPHILREMRVDVQREGRCCMAEVALYAFDIRTGTECGDSVTVAQIMETSIRRTDFLRKLLEAKVSKLSALGNRCGDLRIGEKTEKRIPQHHDDCQQHRRVFRHVRWIDGLIDAAYFISPIVNMERLITDMMGWANVTDKQLQAKGMIETDFGETLSWEYLRYVRRHPVEWEAPTQILYGSRDHLTSRKTIEAFAKGHSAGLTVMEGGEHWFHTEEQMRFLDAWLRGAERKRSGTPRLERKPQ